MRSSDWASRVGLDVAANPADDILVRGLAFFAVLSALLGILAAVAH